ncbi:lipid-A-disaccharide synthase [Aliidiomarina minuta]|uniref:Lipid-A-disaccharide synthase n=1 Tax=Aliidiomarina minuta TaxID=880057 RepID=A0A432W5W3_9GAMM|nr:lipid-A-disaccharide synthase [Aliidiomarina minuta]RUO25421.1 lipid-A-disaccharide synthase [Aliidiomarina minuta]
MNEEQKPLRVAIVAGESSGDILASSLMKALKAEVADIDFIGVGGPLMQQEGMQSLFDIERLSVMGIVDVVKQLPDLLQARRQVIDYMLEQRPDVFIGVDAPDFNIPIELKLKQAGLTTVHYVSPSVWAWRQKRVFKIKAATNQVLCLLPFEKAFYDKFDVPSTFIGHTLADDIPLQNSAQQAREALGLAHDKTYVGLLPGSRRTEVGLLSEPFIKAACLIQQRYPEAEFLVPMVNQARREQFEAALAEHGADLQVTFFEGRSREVMTACDSLLLASGTVSLEAMLLKRPMVVAYKFSWLNYQLLRNLVKVEHFSLPNLLAGEAMVPELLQQQVTAESLAMQVFDHLENDQSALLDKFYQLHQQLQLGASRKAAEAVLNVISKH